MNRKTKTAADRIRARIRAQRIETRARGKATIDKALGVARGAWSDFALQLPGNDAAEQAFNRESFEFMNAAWLAFCRLYGEAYESLGVSR